MGLTDRLNTWITGQPARQQYDPFDYATLASGQYWPLNLNLTQPGAKEEEPDGTFTGYVAGAYRTNSVVFSCLLVRQLLFSEARFQYQQLRKGRPGELFSLPSLDLLEHPWPGGTTGDLLSEVLTHHDIEGNAFIVRRSGRLAVLRPDWVSLILDKSSDAVGPVVVGLAYYPGGEYSGQDPEILQRSEFAHFATIKDPLRRYRGMSPLRPLVREFMADSAATSHKLSFFQNSATPNMVIKLNAALSPDKFAEAVDKFSKASPSGRQAYKNLYLDNMTDVSVIGANLRQMDFKMTQGAGETRIAAALGVPPIIVGLSEGLQAATYSNYGQARRRFADGTMRPLWRNIAGSLETIIPPPPGSRLWYDDRDIQFLAEDKKDLAEVHQLESQQIRTLVDGGYKPDSVVAAVMAGDFSLLQHTGLYSVQLQPPQPDGPSAPPPSVPVAPTGNGNNSARGEMLAFLAGASRQSPNITIHNPAPPDIRVESPVSIAEGAVQVTVESPEVRVEAPVTIAEGAVRVDAPVTIEPTQVTIEDGAVRVESPVTVEAPVTIAEGAVRVDATVEPADVTVNLPEPARTRKVVKRDSAGRISEVTEE